MDDRASRHQKRLKEIDARISSLEGELKKTSRKADSAAYQKEITKLVEEKELRLAILDLKEKQSSA